MSQKKPSLGRGLDALLGQIAAHRAATQPGAVAAGVAPPPPPAAPGAGESVPSAEVPTATAAASPRTGLDEELLRLPLDQLQRGQYQPRVDMRPESLEELASSIRAQGVVQPIVVRPLARVDAGGQRYEIIAGERRWRAAQMAGLPDIPAVVRRVPDEAAIAMALIENIQREDLNALEEARALDRLIREFGVTQQQAADAVGRSRTAVTNLLRLLDLAPEVAALLEKREIEMGHARALLGLTQRRQQVEVGSLVAKKKLSVRDTEALIRRLINPPSSAASGPPALDPNVAQLQSRLTDTLGARVAIEHSARSGKGRVVVSYNSLDELDGILAHIS
jgi:ParB family chromosome partitioning protein